jgi:hypothetical protein
MLIIDFKKINLLFALSLVIFISLVIVGDFRSYSSVPFWDMWNGYLDFYTKAIDGDDRVWWSQHNEHRIVLARIFFWIDIYFFKGLGWFLILSIFFAYVISLYFFFRIYVHKFGNRYPWLIFFIGSLLFSWIQDNNFTWGFQIQFILAQLLPLISFYFLYKFFNNQKDISAYILSCAFGILSIGTMANGVLALPLLFVYSVLVGLGRRYSIILFVLGCACISLYFYDYHKPGGHGSVIDSLLSQPTNFIIYILLYIGSPLFYFFGQGFSGKVVSISASGMMFIVVAGYLYGCLKKPKENSLNLLLIFFIAYIVITAFATAGGRVIFGVDQALSSRYTTPAVMAWAAFILLIIPCYKIKYTQLLRVAALLFLIICLMIPSQIKALSVRSPNFERLVGALALELQIRDATKVQHIFPDVDWALALAKEPATRNISVFGSHPLIDVNNLLHKKYGGPLHFNGQCEVRLDQPEKILGNSQPSVYRIKGSLTSLARQLIPKYLLVLTDENIIEGILLVNPASNRSSITHLSGGVEYSAEGYIFSGSYAKTSFLIVDPDTGCSFKKDINTPFFHIVKASKNINDVSLTAAKIVDLNEWLGSDFNHSHIPGLKIYGSFINSDQDTGSIYLLVNQGEKFLYINGPKNGRQTIEVVGFKNKKFTLPETSQWSVMQISDPTLPRKIKIKITDPGDDWGEWSAIAVKN